MFKKGDLIRFKGYYDKEFGRGYEDCMTPGKVYVVSDVYKSCRFVEFVDDNGKPNNAYVGRFTLYKDPNEVRFLLHIGKEIRAENRALEASLARGKQPS